MELILSKDYTSSSVSEFLLQLRELNLICYASDAAREMDFNGEDEFHEAVGRAMELCIHAGIPVEGNFRRVFTCAGSAVTYDWKLSVLAYQLVCINGFTSNPGVAKMQVDLIKNQTQFKTSSYHGTH